MRKDFETRYQPDGDRPKGKARALRFPAEIEDVLEAHEDWKSLVTEAVQQKISSPVLLHEEGDRGVALEMWSRLRVLLPKAATRYPEAGRLFLQAQGMEVTMTLSDRPWFYVQGSSEFQLMLLDDDWLIEGQGAIVGSELKKAQEFCENMMHIWEQVMISFEFADRIE